MQEKASGRVELLEHGLFETKKNLFKVSVKFDLSNKVRMECLLAVHCILTVSCFHRQLHLKFRLCFFHLRGNPTEIQKKEENLPK